jgi:CPA2 family monovalent cation:H+ antiporter-2
LALTAPFLPSLTGLLVALLWAVPLGLCGLLFWRSATNLLGHVRAGAQVVLELLAAQSRAADPERAAPPAPPDALLAGLGSWVTHRVEPTDRCVAQSLAQLNLRGLTGATVLAILREPQGVAAPAAQEVVRAGDILALSGSSESIDRARRLLRGAGMLPDQLPDQLPD